MFLFPIMNLYKVNDMPPTIYSLLQSIVNFDREEQVKIKDLAKYGHSTIFDFDYPLSEHIDREEFEVMILNKYMMRRIGFDTLTAFQIQLNVKLNEIMPLYNKMFDALDGWNILENDETTTRVKNIDDKQNGTNNITSNITASGTSTSDRRNSELPQNELDNIRDGAYMTDYNYDTDTNSNSSNSQTASTNTNNGLTKEDETIIKSRNNAIESMKVYRDFLETKKNIYTMIFEDLDELFYGLV